MAYIQNTITDLDDLLIQISSINGNGTTISITTAANHTVSAGDLIDISGTTNYNGSYTVATASGTSITITNALNPGSETAGQIIIDGTSGTSDGKYNTPEFFLDCVTKRFYFKGAGNLITDGSGVTGQALYSYFKFLWKNVQSISKYDFPMLSITNEQFEFINDWEPDDTVAVNQDNSFSTTSRKMLRTCGWSESTGAGVSKQKWFGFVSLGTIGLTDQPYYVQQSGFEISTTPTEYTGPANEPIKFYGDVTHGNIDYEGVNSYFKVFVRTRGKTYTNSQLSDIGVSESTYIVYRFPLSNANDLNINTTDDAAFTGSTISSIDGDATTITVTTSADHGLYAGSPVTISGTTGYNGTFTVAALDGTTPLVKFTIASTNHNIASEATGTVKLGFVDVMKLNYLPNPYSDADSVVIKGQYLDSVTYDPGDVVYDGNDADRWYYLNQAGTSSGGTDNTIGNSNGTWASWTDGERNIEEDSTTWSAYSVVFEMNNNTGSAGATKEAAYEYAQYLLRQSSDINDDATSAARNGDIADTIVYFVGSQLHTYSDSSIPFAVVLDDIAEADLNNITYHEALLVESRTSDAHTSPIVVPVIINFNANLAYSGTDAVFYAYYKTGTGSQDFGTVDALQLVDKDGDPVGLTIKTGMTESYQVPTGGSYSFSYSYTSDTTNGRAGDTPVDIVVVAIGLTKGQYVVSEGTISSTGGSVSLVAPLERNYSNP